MTQPSRTFGPHFRDRTPRGWLVIAALAVALVLGFFALNAAAPGGRRIDRIEGMDAVVYFDVAHSLVFDRDLDLTNELRHVAPVANSWTSVQPATGRPGSPYAIGYSLLTTPFLVLGTGMDALAGRPTDGYASAARTAYTLANVLFTGVGLLLLYDFLTQAARLFSPGAPRRVTAGDRHARPGTVSDTAISAWVVAIMLVATPVAYYAYGGMAHAATFLLGSAFLAAWVRAYDSTSVPRWAIAGLLGGVLSITRWQDIFFVGTPLLVDLGSVRDWTAPARRGAWLKSRTVYSVAAAACWIPQLLEWKSIYGHYLTVPQGGGFLEFPPRFVPQVLFSSQHGWFLWTPIALLGVAGLVAGLRRLPQLFAPWLVVIACEVLLMGAMPTNWSGTDSFGQRSLTSLVPLLALGTANLLWSTRGAGRAVIASSMAACAAFTLAFAAQFRLNLIPRDGRLTAAELFADKLQLRRALQRKRVVADAEQLRARGDVAGAVRQLQTAAWKYGPDRQTLDGLILATRQAGDSSAHADAIRQLAALRARELW